MAIRKRIKGTPFWGVVTGNGGTIDKPLIEVTMGSGEKVLYSADQLTDKSIKEVIKDFMWSVFSENGSRKNQLIFVGSCILIAFAIGSLIFL